MDILTLISQRRVWAGFVGAVAILLGLLKYQFSIDVPVVTDLLTNFGGAVAQAIIAGLALWSYFKPKTQN